MSTPLKTEARPLLQKFFGADWINSVPPKWRAGLRYFVTKIPGVANGTDPDEITGDVVASQTTTDRTNETEKETTSLNADLLLNAIGHGQSFDEKLGVTKQFSEYVTKDNVEVGLPGRDISILNSKLSEVRKYDTSAVAAALADIVLQFTGSISLGSLELPKILKGIDVIIKSSTSDGDYSETTRLKAGDFWFPGVGIRQDAMGRAQGGATIIAEVLPYIQHPPRGRISTNQVLFFLRLPFIEADVVARLSTLLDGPILPWPQFDETEAKVVVTGERLALEASTRVGYTTTIIIDDPVITFGKGKSVDKTLSMRVAEIQPTIHGPITINVIGDKTASVTVESHSTIGTEEGGGALDPSTLMQSDEVVTDETVEATVSPKGFAATNVTTIPTSGLYALPSSAEPYISTIDADGNITRFAMVHCELVDFANIIQANAGGPVYA